jgi:putative selenate reductase
MGDVMRPIPYRELLRRAVGEYRRKRTVFDIPEAHFHKSSGLRAPVFSSSCENPLGPAAGPHTQLAQNIVAAWLAGARYVELKTVQKLDTLHIDKPCIDAADEGYNVEWSTELTLDQAFDEYLKAWFLLHVFETLAAPRKGSAGRSPAGSPSFLFNMSVGYDLEGIKSERMDRFIGRLINCAGEERVARYREQTEEIAADPSFFDATPWREGARLLRSVAEAVPTRICHSVTLSTMHGCPPREIEAICAYMLREKRLDTLVKLNPTLLGYDAVSSMLGGLGYGGVELKREGFAKDLQWADAVPMLRRLASLGKAEGRHFGAKLSNTLACANHGEALPGTERYMSGRSLYPLTISLAARLAAEFDGSLPLSFSGGISAWNIVPVLEAGVRPITMATDLLKPGGYGRLKELAVLSESASASWALPAVDPAKLAAAARAALEDPRFRKDFRGAGEARVSGELPLLDCAVAPCVSACPIAQDVPQYIHLAGAGRVEEALRVIWERNPLPFITGYLCDHQCTQACTRLDWEGPVRIRDMKRISAERGYESLRASREVPGRAAPSRGVKAAVVGAGPAGLAAAGFLAREGFEVHVFEREADAGGVVRYTLPGFRLPLEAVEKDVSFLKDLGVHFHFGESGPLSAAQLLGRGFRAVVAAFGAEADRDAGVPGAQPVLAFLRRFRQDPRSVKLGPAVVVIGAGDTAMDAARAARRSPGVDAVTVVYRRSEAEMPASEEEYRTAREEGISFRFLRQPEAWEKGELVLREMRLGEPDAGGRARPVAADRTERIPADAVISAVGAAPDVRALAAFGLGEESVPADPVTQETAVRGVYLIGDAAAGASTIVKAIASARRAADAISAREGGSRFSPRAAPSDWLAEPRGYRDRMTPVSAFSAPDDTVAQTEARRCLACSAVCLKCVEVCPNRANTAIPVPGMKDADQIVHLDAFCNECGNCATFCPWEGRPYRDKLTVFSSPHDFHHSENPGFYLADGRGLLRLGGRTVELSYGGNDGLGVDAPQAVRDLMVVILRDHPHLLGPVD